MDENGETPIFQLKIFRNHPIKQPSNLYTGNHRYGATLRQRMNCEVGQGAEETVEQQHLNNNKDQPNIKSNRLESCGLQHSKQICSLWHLTLDGHHCFFFPNFFYSSSCPVNSFKSSSVRHSSFESGGRVLEHRSTLEPFKWSMLSNVSLSITQLRRTS